jgi:hypothetical protein
MLNTSAPSVELLRLTKSEREFHRKSAVTCFNRAWDYLDMKKRDPAAEEMMLHLAHASRYHWSIVGTPRNQAVGDWQLARVYAAVGAPELSLQFALSALNTCEKKHLDELLPSALEGVARAYAAAGDSTNGRRILKMARQTLARLELPADDRRIFSAQIRETEGLLRSGRKG